MLRVCSKVCKFLPTSSLPVYQNAYLNSVCEKVYTIRFYFQCSSVNINKYKGKYFLEEFLMLLMDRNFNPHAITNKQAAIIISSLSITMGIYQLRYGALR